LKYEFYWKEASGLQSKKYRAEGYAEIGCWEALEQREILASRTQKTASKPGKNSHQFGV
jgi:hypothetical protein